MQALQEAHGAAESSGTTAGYWKNSEAMQRRADVSWEYASLL